MIKRSSTNDKINMMLKGLVPKTRVLLTLKAILGVYEFLLQTNLIGVILKVVLAPPSVPIGVSGRFLSTIQKLLNKVCATVIKCASHSSGR